MKNGKLVRDLIPEIIQKQGKIPIIRTLAIEEYKKELSKKLIEEASEFQADQNIEELADIIEVFDTILKTFGFTKQELAQARAKKRTERGAFKNRIFLENTD